MDDHCFQSWSLTDPGAVKSQGIQESYHRGKSKKYCNHRGNPHLCPHSSDRLSMPFRDFYFTQTQVRPLLEPLKASRFYCREDDRGAWGLRCCWCSGGLIQSALQASTSQVCLQLFVRAGSWEMRECPASGQTPSQWGYNGQDLSRTGNHFG